MRVVTDRRAQNGMVECPRCGPRPGRVVEWGTDGCPLVVECLACYRRVPIDAGDTPAPPSPPPPARARPRPRPFELEMAAPLACPARPWVVLLTRQRRRGGSLIRCLCFNGCGPTDELTWAMRFRTSREARDCYRALGRDHPARRGHRATFARLVEARGEGGGP